LAWGKEGCCVDGVLKRKVDMDQRVIAAGSQRKAREAPIKTQRGVVGRGGRITRGKRKGRSYIMEERPGKVSRPPSRNERKKQHREDRTSSGKEGTKKIGFLGGAELILVSRKKERKAKTA